MWRVRQNGQSYTVTTATGPWGSTSCLVMFNDPKPSRDDFIAAVSNAVTLNVNLLTLTALPAAHQARYFLLSAPSAGEAIAAAGVARKSGSSGTGSAGMVAPSGLVSTCWNTPRAL